MDILEINSQLFRRESVMSDSFKTRATLKVDKKEYQYFSLKTLEEKLKGGFKLSRLPYSYKILLENLLRHEDGENTTKDDIEALATADLKKLPQQDINFTPARVILQDFTGVPCVVDLAAMRDAIKTLGGKASQVNPLCPVELVIDHSVMVDHYGSKEALDLNANIEFLARVVFDRDGLLYPDTVFGTDSHTTMANGIGVLGWGVGGIEAEAAM